MDHHGAVAGLIDYIRENKGSIVQAVYSSVVTVVPNLGLEGERQVILSCEAHIDLFVRLFEIAGRDNIDQLELTPPRETLDYIDLLVQGGYGIKALINGLIIGCGSLLREATTCVNTLPAHIEAKRYVLELVSDTVAKYTAAAVDVVAVRFEDEMWARTVGTSKSASVVLRMISGDSYSLSEASNSVPFDFDAPCIAILISEKADRVRELDTSRFSLVKVALQAVIPKGGPEMLSVQVGYRRWCVWLPGVRSLSENDLSGITEGLQGAGYIGAIGFSHGGIEGFINAYRQAEDAILFSQSAGGRSTLTSYRDVCLEIVVNAEKIKSRRMASALLGPLLGKPQQHRDLISTLVTLLDCEMNQRKAAENLDVHPGTVRYRYRKLSELLGFDIRDHSHALFVATVIARGQQLF